MSAGLPLIRRCVCGSMLEPTIVKDRDGTKDVVWYCPNQWALTEHAEVIAEAVAR